MYSSREILGVGCMARFSVGKALPILTNLPRSRQGNLPHTVLGYSRRLYCRAFLAQRQDDWLEGLEGAFQHFGGLTEQVLCDNASPLVTSHDRQSGQVVWNPGFETF